MNRYVLICIVHVSKLITVIQIVLVIKSNQIWSQIDSKWSKVVNRVKINIFIKILISFFKEFSLSSQIYSSIATFLYLTFIQLKDWIVKIALFFTLLSSSIGIFNAVLWKWDFNLFLNFAMSRWRFLQSPLIYKITYFKCLT